jgi:hypothetical protein
MKVFPPVRRAMSRVAAGQIADDKALESLGAGLDPVPPDHDTSTAARRR